MKSSKKKAKDQNESASLLKIFGSNMHEVIKADDPLVNEYNEFDSPPDFKIAELHGQASLAGNWHNHKERVQAVEGFDLQSLVEAHLDQMKNKDDHCPCCGRERSSTLVALSQRTETMGSLGFSVPFFFEYSKFLMLALFLLFIIYCCYQIVRAVKSNRCKYLGDQPVSEQCGAAWKFFLSMGNIESTQQDFAEKIFFVVSLVALFGIRIAYTLRFEMINRQLESKTKKIEDYTVVVRNIPDTCIEQELKKLFSGLRYKLQNNRYHIGDLSKKVRNDVDVNFEIYKINFVFKKYNQLLEHDKNLKQELKRFRKTLQSDFEKGEINKQNFDMEREKTDKLLKDEFMMGDGGDTNKKPKTRKHHFAGVAYVTLESEYMAKMALKHFGLSGIPRLFLKYLGSIPRWVATLPGGRKQHLEEVGSYVFIDKAHSPSDIIWENAGYQSLSLLSRKIFSLLGSLAVIALSLVILVTLKISQIKNNGDFWTTILLTVAIKVNNSISSILNTFFVKLEKSITLTNYESTKLIRTILMTFFNSTIQLVAVNYYVLRGDLGQKMWRNVGLANDLWFFQLLAISDAASSLIKPGYFLKKLKIWYYKRQGIACGLTQKEANELCEGLEFLVSERLSKYCRLLLLSMFLASIFPLAPIMGLIYILVFYWVDKFFLLRLAKVPPFCTGGMGRTMLQFFDLSLVFYSAGYIIFEYITDGIFTLIPVVAFFATSIIRLFNVGPLIVGLTFKDNEEKWSKVGLNTKDYQNFYNNTYEKNNPIDLVKRNLDMYSRPGFLDARAHLIKTTFANVFENADFQKLMGENEDKSGKDGNNALFGGLGEGILQIGAEKEKTEETKGLLNKLLGNNVMKTLILTPAQKRARILDDFDNLNRKFAEENRERSKNVVPIPMEAIKLILEDNKWRNFDEIQ